MSAEEVAKAFVQHYYTTLDSNPQALIGLYVSFRTIVVMDYNTKYLATSIGTVL